MFGRDRRELRRMYADAWKKRCDKLPLSPLEAQIADVVELHPEYHADVAGGDLDRDFTPEGGRTNPFLHMGLHLGIREQVATDRPSGIAAVYEAVVAATGDPHAAEHRMIECLAETLWEAQNANAPPDETKYLERLRCLAQ
ncbi:MAG: DUF1841 family protein [Proteobacteria bacterium]|nr:DUF1841 family protein [Pseudomonadota bacterium]